MGTNNRKNGKKPKIFILDTNIILHDFMAVRKFQDNDIVIPVAVLEELDKFKKGNDNLSYNARGFMRELDRLSGNNMFGENGIPIGRGLGRIKVELNHPFPDDLKGCFQDDTQDHRILATAIWVRDHNPDRFVALVTKDINLRMKSKAVGMEAQDYLTDKIEESRVEYTRNEVVIVENPDWDAIQGLAFGQGSIPYESLCSEKPMPNQLYKFRMEKNGQHTNICAI